MVGRHKTQVTGIPGTALLPRPAAFFVC